MRIVIIGATETGRLLANFFSVRADDVVIVDQARDQLDTIDDDVDAMTLTGVPFHRQVLVDAGVPEAKIVFAVTGDDALNLVTASLSKEMGARVALARVDDPQFYQNHGIEYGVLGIDAVMCSARIASMEILRAIQQLEAMYVSNMAGFSVQVALCHLGEDSPVLGEAPEGIHLAHGAAIRGVLRDDFLMGPEELRGLEVDDRVLVVAPVAAMPDALQRLVAHERSQRAIIVGGGYAGMQVAVQLARPGVRVQLIEQDKARADYLAQALPNTTVIRGDGTSLELLSDLQIEGLDLFISLTQDDETNLTAALLARHLGVRHTYTIVRREGYRKVYKALGVDDVVERHAVLAQAMIETVLRASTPDLEPLPYSEHALLELEIPAQVGAAHRDAVRLDAIPMPAHARILTHVRQGRVLQPMPSAHLRGGDVLVLAILPRHIQKITQALARLV